MATMRRAGWSLMLPAILLLFDVRSVAATTTKTADVRSVLPGGTITWTVTLTNDFGAGRASVVVTDDVPDPADGLPFARFDCATDVWQQPAGAACSYNGDVATWTFDLRDGATDTLVFVSRVYPTATPQLTCNSATADYVLPTMPMPTTQSETAGPACVAIVEVFENCSNIIDDDRDGMADCDDSECLGDVACVPEICDNAQDENADGRFDCQDLDCVGDAACAGIENCVNGADDDADTLADCADPDCGGDIACAVEDCADGIDNDGNTVADCCDPECAMLSVCAAETNCANMRDDDCDSLLDCQDDDCNSSPVCENCVNRIDDDADGRIDCQDLDCVSNPACARVENCINGIDDNENGYIDCAEWWCYVYEQHCWERANCADGIDNDRDGLRDCADPQCAGDPACPENCSNGTDDDFDRLVDCADFDCLPDVACPELECTDGLDNDLDDCRDGADSDCGGSEAACGNLADDDCDGLSDCADADCIGGPACGGENCTDLRDDDGDGAIDCIDTECLLDPSCAGADVDRDGRMSSIDCAPASAAVWAIPAEVPDTMQADEPVGTTDAMLSWDSLAAQAGPGTRYDVVSGVILDGRSSRGVTAAICLADDLTGTTFTDARVLNQPANGYYYLVRGDNSCDEGTYGFDGLGREHFVTFGDCP